MDKIAIVGRGIGHKNALLSGCKIWTMQKAYSDIGFADKVFRLHEHEQQLGYIQNVDIVSFCDIQTEGLIKMFGDVFHSSVAWMLAYAVFIGHKHIELYGIDMAVDGEYGSQRDGLNRLIGKVEAIGCNVIIPTWSGIYCPPGLYSLRR